MFYTCPIGVYSPDDDLKESKHVLNFKYKLTLTYCASVWFLQESSSWRVLFRVLFQLCNDMK